MRVAPVLGDTVGVAARFGHQRGTAEIDFGGSLTVMIINGTDRLRSDVHAKNRLRAARRLDDSRLNGIGRLTIYNGGK